MVVKSILWWASVAFAIVGAVVFVVGLARRWLPGADGRPRWASDPARFGEPWTAAAFGLVILAVLMQAASRLT